MMTVYSGLDTYHNGFIAYQEANYHLIKLPVIKYS